MKKALLTTAIILATTATNANAENWPRWYVGLGAGVTYQDDSDVDDVAGITEFEYDAGYSINGALGYRLQPEDTLFGDHGNIELEVGYREQDIDNSAGQVEVTTYAVNYVEHFGSGPTATPYLGAGVGFANVDVVDNIQSDSDTVPFYQILAGVGYEPETIPHTRFKLGYRYLGTFEDPSFSTGDFEYDNHSIEVGAEFNF